MTNVKITVVYEFGLRVKKPKSLDVPCFAFDVERGSNIFGNCVAPSGYKVAMALRDDGSRVIPDLKMAELAEFFAHGFRVRGICEEYFQGHTRSFYCEWYVRYQENNQPK